MISESFAPLGEVADFINGKAFKPSDWESDGKRIIRIQNLSNPDKPYNRTTSDVDARYLVEPGTLLVSWSATLGVFEWNESDTAVLNQHIFKVVPDEKKICQRYLRYALGGAIARMTRYTHGSTMKHINRREFLDTQIFLPPLPEQKRIAAILDKADAIRRKRQEAIELSEQFLRSVFLEMFGDPVTNPKGWEPCELFDLSEKFSDGPFGSNLKSSHYTSSGVRVIRLQNIGVGKLVDNDKAFVSQEHFDSLRKHECMPGDVLIGTLGDPNLRACLLPSRISVALNKADCVQFRAKKGVSTAEFAMVLLNLPETLHLAKGMMHGQTRTRVSMGQLKKLNVFKPPYELQAEFSEVVKRFEQMSKKWASNGEELNCLFGSLSQRAFKGEL